MRTRDKIRVYLILALAAFGLIAMSFGCAVGIQWLLGIKP